MNAKQAARAAAKRIEELEDYARRASADIKAYNVVIDGIIGGHSPCEWCEDRNECKKEDKDGPGCNEWMLMWNHGQKGADFADETDKSERVSEASSLRGA